MCAEFDKPEKKNWEKNLLVCGKSENCSGDIAGKPLRILNDRRLLWGMDSLDLRQILTKQNENVFKQFKAWLNMLQLEKCLCSTLQKVGSNLTPN